ncbi:sensor histidine kinase [Hymenobacter elongatus]|uniref:Signal transduction histidine kinase internal region domain-containing protein n=1 Tax=Hymenobacter elongatus TaxID=877208 RepID=A0A4Z0PN62_9BACT|nr:histidine kinase [Hymenobacter elongatus]TGE17542.1 hypothetical protein E5J99_06730 [Hymenobacter elongatus]
MATGGVDVRKAWQLLRYTFLGSLLLLYQNIQAADTTDSDGSVRLVDRQGRVWEAAAPGLLLTDGPRRTRFTTRNGLSNDTVTALAQDDAGQIWVGTREGLLRYDGAAFREMTYTQGLPSKRIHHLYQAPQGPLWVATAEGVLRYTNRRFGAVAALQGRDVRFVGEAARQWVFITSQGIVRLPKEQPVSWAWLGWLSGGLVAAGAGAWGVRNMRRGQRVQTQLAQVEQRALLAQMNPHFIFNSLQSIQKYILHNQAEAAQHYLTRFGALMRLILEQSRQPLLTVRDEVRMLRGYLELEALRFEGQFTYDVVVEDETLLAEEIPAMLLHPFVENAVWHGLSHHTGQGHIEVRFARDGAYLTAVVQDNGIGRRRAAGQRGTHAGYPSRGSAIVEERVALLNRQARRPLTIQILDLTSADTPPEGTRVVVRIPALHS